MRSFFGVLALAAASEALIAQPKDACGPFSIIAAGGPHNANGIVGELFDGQNRIGQSNLPVPQGKYYITKQGGAKPTTGFSIGCNGELSYDNSTEFWTCPTGDHGGWNIYTKPVANQKKCAPVWLMADNCKPDCSPKTSSASCSTSTKTKTKISTSTCSSSTKTSTKTSSTTCTTSYKPEKTSCSTSTMPTTSSCPSKTSTWTSSSSCQSKTKTWSTSTSCKPKATCPGTLSKNFEFPHLIIPVDKSQPDKKYSNSFNGTASGPISSIFNFDIPAWDANKTCTLAFLFPEQSQLETSAYTISGNGELDFSVLNKPAHRGTCYSDKPSKKMGVVENFIAKPGSAKNLMTFGCSSYTGRTLAVEMTAVGDTCFNYFQDFNPCPIGLYINVSD